jgi:excinuclease ABC subunit A
VQTAFYEGKGICHTRIKTDKKFSYSNNFELDGITFLNQMSICLVSTILTVLAPYARYGNIIGIDAELVVPNTTLSVRTLYSLERRKYELVP